jgi:hypothetical protein
VVIRHLLALAFESGSVFFFCGNVTEIFLSLNTSSAFSVTVLELQLIGLDLAS